MTVPQLSRVGFGAANLGDLHVAMTEEESWEVLEAAWASGIRYFDTAPHYGLGLSERRLGRFLQTKPRDEFIVSTKVGRLIRPARAAGGSAPSTADGLTRVWDASARGIQASVEESLERLGLDRVDILYLHDPELYGLDAALAEAAPTLVRLREEGIVQSVGVGSMAMEALIRSAQTGAFDMLMVAGRYTLAEHDGVAELRAVCRAADVRLVTASVFNSGLLATALPGQGARYNYGTAPAELLTRVRAIAGVCEKHGVDLPTAALQYTLRDPLVASVVVGTGRAAQVAENARRVAVAIPDDLWSSLMDSGYIV